jgi:hypothetical protein
VVAKLMAGALGWDAARIDREVDTYLKRVAAERESQSSPTTCRPIEFDSKHRRLSPGPKRGAFWVARQQFWAVRRDGIAAC